MKAGPVSKQDWAELRRQSLASIDDVVAEVGLPNVLLPYQQQAVGLLDSGSVPVLVAEKSRRIGFTWALGAYAVLRAGRARSAVGQDVMYISYSQEMTREFVDACAMWARAFAVAAAEAEETLFDNGEADAIQAFRIRFASGFEVLALSSAPRTLRGKQGVVIIDEAAFVDSLKELLKAALANLMWGGQVIVVSTHNGTENEFNVVVQDILAGRSKYRHFRVDLDEALLQGLYQRICLVRRLEWSPDAEAAWRQDLIEFYGDAADEELFCIPSQGSGTWLPAPLIEARMTAAAPILRLDLPADFLHRSELEQRALVAPFMADLDTALKALDQRKMHAFGFDFARVADLSVAELLSIDQTLRRSSELTVEMRRVPGDEQKAVTKAILKAAPRLVGAAFDATGMGWTVAEDMGRIFGLRESEGDTGLVWPIKLGQEWYRLQMPPLKAAFEDEAIAIAKDDEHLADLRLVKVIRGIARVPDLRTGETGKKRHGDFAIALALAYFASRMQWHEFGYRSVAEGGNREGPGDFMRPGRDDDERGDKRWWRPPLGSGLRGSI